MKKRYLLTPFGKEFVFNLKKEIDLSKIDYIISNHSEVDHSGAFIWQLRMEWRVS